MLRNPVALIVLVALSGVIYLAANDKEIPAVLAAVLGFLAGSLIVRRG